MRVRGVRAAECLTRPTGPYGEESVEEATTELDGLFAQVGAGDHRLTILGGVGLAIGVKHKAAHFAYQEFFHGKLRNPHTRVAYERAVRRFLAWCQDKGLELQQISPAAVGRYLDEHPA